MLTPDIGKVDEPAPRDVGVVCVVKTLRRDVGSRRRGRGKTTRESCFGGVGRHVVEIVEGYVAERGAKAYRRKEKSAIGGFSEEEGILEGNALIVESAVGKVGEILLCLIVCGLDRDRPDRCRWKFRPFRAQRRRISAQCRYVPDDFRKFVSVRRAPEWYIEEKENADSCQGRQQDGKCGC